MEKENKKIDFHKHLLTVFVISSIINYTLVAIVNYYTIKRLNGH